MKQTWLTTLAGIIFGLAAASNLTAVQVDAWPYDRLRGESDLIIVAEPVETKPSGERVSGPLWQVDFPGVNTTLKVKGVIKGRYRDPELTLFHLRYPEGVRLANGPFLGDIKTQPVAQPQPDGTRRSEPPEYLLFLKRRPDGRFEPTSGPMDSAYAIRELRIPASGQ